MAGGVGSSEIPREIHHSKTAEVTKKELFSQSHTAKEQSGDWDNGEIHSSIPLDGDDTIAEHHIRIEKKDEIHQFHRVKQKRRRRWRRAWSPILPYPPFLCRDLCAVR